MVGALVSTCVSTCAAPPRRVVLTSIVPNRILGVIPARYASSRFPGKALVSIAGKTMLQHVWERASQARYLTGLAIATDDERIRAAAQDFSARVVMTRDDHASGTDRVAEVASASNAEIIVNIQGDEPTIDPAAIDAAVLGLLEAEEVPMGTLKTRIENAADIADPNVVKVVTDAQGNAIYFSRYPIPFVRTEGETAARFKHIGLYVYRRDFLLGLSGLAHRPARTRRTPGTIAGSRKRLQDSRGGDRLRFVWRRYARGLGESFGII